MTASLCRPRLPAAAAAPAGGFRRCARGHQLAIRWRCSPMTAQVKSDPSRTAEKQPPPDMVGPDGSAVRRQPNPGHHHRDTAWPSVMRCCQGQQLAVVEAMKMEHVIAAPQRAGIVRRRDDGIRATWCAKAIRSSFVEQADGSPVAHFVAEVARALDPDRHPSRPGRKHRGATPSPSMKTAPKRCARRHANAAIGCRARTSTELVDPGSFDEYWPLIVARQHQRYDVDTLRKNISGRRADRGDVPRSTGPICSAM